MAALLDWLWSADSPLPLGLRSGEARSDPRAGGNAGRHVANAHHGRAQSEHQGYLHRSDASGAWCARRFRKNYVRASRLGPYVWLEPGMTPVLDITPIRAVAAEHSSQQGEAAAR